MQKLPLISHYTLEHKNSHRFHRSAQMLIALFSHRIHRTHRTFCYKNLCKSVKSVGDYLSRRSCGFREFCGRLSQQKVLCIPRILWEIFSAEDSVGSVNSVGAHPGGAAVSAAPTEQTVRLLGWCTSCSVGALETSAPPESTLRICEICGRFYSKKVYSVGGYINRKLCGCVEGVSKLKYLAI